MRSRNPQGVEGGEGGDERRRMEQAPQAADAATPENVKVKVQAEFRIEPLDHVPLGQRRAMLLAGGQMTSAPASFPTCERDAALKKLTPRLLLEVFMSELAHALKPLHDHQEQIITESSSRYDLKNGLSSGEQIYDSTFTHRRSAEIDDNTVVAHFEPVKVSSHMAVNIEDGQTFEDCRSQESQPNVCRCSRVVPCFGLKGCSSGHRDTDAVCDHMVLSSPNSFIELKVEPSNTSAYRDACIARERRSNMISESKQELVDHTSRYKQCSECFEVDVTFEPDRCLASLAKARNITAMQGRTKICYLDSAYQQGLSTHARGMSEQLFRYPENDLKEHAANELNDKVNNVDTEFPLEKHVVDSSEVNATCTSMNDTPQSSIASPTCTGVRLSPMGVNNQCVASLEASMHRSERNGDINLDRACGVDSGETVGGLQGQPSLKSNKRLPDFILSSDPARMKCEFGDNNCLSEASAAKRMRTSMSVYSEGYSPKRVCEVLSDACKHNLSSGTSNLPDKEVQSLTVGQKEAHFKADCLPHDSSLSTSIVTVKVEPADEDADAQLSETYALQESHVLPARPNTLEMLQACICQDNIPFAVHNMQQDYEHGSTSSQEVSTNHIRAPPVAEREGNCGSRSQLCDSASSLSHAGIKVEVAEESSVNQVRAANDLCGSILCPRKGSIVRSKGGLLEENCDNKAPEDHVSRSAFDSQQNSVPVNRYAVPEVLSMDVSYKKSTYSSANDLQRNQRCTVFSNRATEDVTVAIKQRHCSNAVSQSPGGEFLFSPGRVKVETPEDTNAVCSCGTTTATKFSTSTVDSSNKFDGDLCQDTLHSGMQTIREDDTMCSDKMSANAPTGNNLSDVPPVSVLSTYPITVKVETLEGNHVGGVSETEDTANFSCSASDSSDKVGGVNASAGMPVGEEQQICCNMASLLPDSVLSTFQMRVKDEPLEEVHVDGDSQSETNKYSRPSMFGSSNNVVVMNHLPDEQCSSKAINFQNDTPSRVCSVRVNQESTISSPQINIPEVTRIVAGQKQTSMANRHSISDVSVSKDIKNAEQLEERCANILSESSVGILSSSCLSSNQIVKSAPAESGIQNLCDNPLGSFPGSDNLLIEAKSEIFDEPYVDILDHMPLTERINMLAVGMVSELKPARKSGCFKQTRVHAVGCDSVSSLKVKGSTHRRKRKKTATDSVEIALEEDAPGLLQGLLDRGINLNEIKLYGCEEDGDALEISPNEDSFEDLEAVICKLFSERPTSLFKLAPLRSAKSTKAVYCLACLISLIEQTRYLRFRNSPVEWGWCRDLQSFIFVFKMHNRIVLERPEYGYATYFFELVESFPIDWQIKRLVTAMKLTSCSRATLIENKSLLVGVDLSGGEAQVLEEYGWQRNTGLGSMLNYCDRVVHDRNERDVSEWRLKIGRLLMDGYDGGRIVKADLPKRVVDYAGGHYPVMKLET